jgi:hypothetical protein
MLERGLYQAVSVSEDEVDAWLASAARIVWSTLYSASVG